MPGVMSVKAEELQTLDAEELNSRLKGARRELYELRFKLAVGQLDDHRQIRKVRKDIARILTVVHARRLEGAPEAELPEVSATQALEAEEPAADAAAGPESEATPEDVEAQAEAEASAPAQKSRRRATVEEEGND
jgi:large subunit ribosomal protein L29